MVQKPIAMSAIGSRNCRAIYTRAKSTKLSTAHESSNTENATEGV